MPAPLGTTFLYALGIAGLGALRNVSLQSFLAHGFWDRCIGLEDETNRAPLDALDYSGIHAQDAVPDLLSDVPERFLELSQVGVVLRIVS
jgi:hypothetical protein